MNVIATAILALAFALFVIAALDYRKKAREFRNLIAILKGMKRGEALFDAPRKIKEIR